MSTSLKGQIALVTGAAGGLGLPVVKRLAARGAVVVATDISASGIAEAKRSTDQFDVEAARGGTMREGTVHWRELDVADESAVNEVFDWAGAELGACSILVNNAIKPCAIPHSFIDTGLEQWRSDYSIIVEGAVSCSRAALRQMVTTGRGSIVNISSVNAVGFYGHPPYSAAKAALLSLTRSIAVQYAPQGIRCNAIVPGTIKTPAWSEQVAANPETFEILRQWYPSGDVAEPEQIAELVLFLASEQSRAVNGASLVADGGLTAGNLAMSRFVEGVPDPA